MDAKRQVSQLNSKIKNIQANNKNYLYNIENGLANTKNKKFKKILVYGDSIGAGTAATNNRGWAWQIQNTLNVNDGYNFGYYDFSTQITWTTVGGVVVDGTAGTGVLNGWTYKKYGLAQHMLVSGTPITTSVTTANFTNGSTAVTATSGLNGLAVGQLIKASGDPDSAFVKIASITNDGALVLASNYTGTTTSSNNTTIVRTADIPCFPYGSWMYPANNGVCNIVYYKRPGGGQFDVKVGSSVVATIDCNSITNQDAICTTDINITKGSSVTIQAKTSAPVYVSHILYWYAKSTPHNEFINFSVGGKMATDYTDDEIDIMYNWYSADLFIWELLTNDYSYGVSLSSYISKAERAISGAKSKGMDVLIVIPCGNNGSETNPVYSQYVQAIWNLAKKYNCALIDFNARFGGWSKAYANKLMGDTVVHPSDYGHRLMANDIIITIFDMPNPYNNSLTRYDENTGYTNVYWINHETDENFNAGLSFDPFKTYLRSNDNNGYTVWRHPQSLIFVSTSAALPKYAYGGTVAIVGTLGTPSSFHLYVCTTESLSSTACVWTQLI